MSLSAQNAAGLAVRLGVLRHAVERFPTLKHRVRREPDRLDAVPARAHGPRAARATSAGSQLDRPPSEIVRGRVWGCVFDDQHGLNSRDAVGLEHILFETDYPHTDGTWPHSRAVAHRLCAGAGMDAGRVLRQFLRGNAIACYGLERFGITA